MPRTHPLPLLLLTGFLGSGKTTTLGHWLRHTDIPLKRIAVIINDFGSVNVDAGVLARRELELRSITGGCVCCQSFEDLVAQVAALAANPELDLAWIETSGLADPEEVLDHLSAPELQESTVIRKVILVVDGTDFPCSWRGRAVQEEQVRYADLILLNKIDRLEDKSCRQIELNLREINLTARIVLAKQGEIAPQVLNEADVNSTLSHPPVHGCGHEHDSREHHRENADKMPHAASSFFVPLGAPVERATFMQFLRALPASVFRAKGFIRLADSPEKLHTFQQVREQSELLLLPLENVVDLSTGLVFIGPSLDEKKIRELARMLVQVPLS